MRRIVLLVAFAVVLVLVAWSAGRAQAQAANFYLTVDAPAGELKVKCLRGCNWPDTPGEPPQTIAYQCERRPCILTFTGEGRVYVGQPR